ncbi:MAG: hypothetical protein LAO08_12070, partial [Acidobacteriia bacterium]|nr:hypothetical protein [Terriglobia bacterium]
SPPCQLNPVQPNERPSYLNQYLALVVSWDASLPPHSTTSRDLRRTIPLTGNPANPTFREDDLTGLRIMCRCAAVLLEGVYTLKMEKIKIEQHSFVGSLWFGAWLFTIGFLHLTFWKGVLAIVLWPYYLGMKFSSLLH